MSADWSPVCGRAVTMLSIFTASTGLSARTGSPVNGEYSCVETTRVGAGCGCRGIVGRADGLAGAAELDSATTSEIVNATTTATAGKPARRAIRRRLLKAGLLISGTPVGRSLPAIRHAIRETREIGQFPAYLPQDFGAAASTTQTWPGANSMRLPSGSVNVVPPSADGRDQRTVNSCLFRSTTARPEPVLTAYGGREPASRNRDVVICVYWMITVA